MATFNIIEWALREIKTAVKNGEDIDDAKWAVEAMCRVENLSNKVHDIKDRYDSAETMELIYSTYDCEHPYLGRKPYELTPEQIAIRASQWR